MNFTLPQGSEPDRFILDRHDCQCGGTVGTWVRVVRAGSLPDGDSKWESTGTRLPGPTSHAHGCGVRAADRRADGVTGRSGT